MKVSHVFPKHFVNRSKIVINTLTISNFGISRVERSTLQCSWLNVAYPCVEFEKCCSMKEENLNRNFVVLCTKNNDVFLI